uniref:Uncharacterized protein n=1 Tax=Anguilla anguilla TaxID=7936 RepID=A0A0E9RS61_ANGAN
MRRGTPFPLNPALLGSAKANGDPHSILRPKSAVTR